MKYLHLIWASLFRRKTRTILTLVSIVAAFLLFGLLDAVRTLVRPGRPERQRRAAPADRLAAVVHPDAAAVARGAHRGRCRASRPSPTPTGSAAPTRIRTTRSSASRWRPTTSTCIPRWRSAPPSARPSPTTRTGVLVGEGLATRFGWKVGDRIPMQSTIFPDKSGSKNWVFDIERHHPLHRQEVRRLLRPDDAAALGLLRRHHALQPRPGRLVRDARDRRQPGRPRGQGDRRAVGQLRPRDAHADRAGRDRRRG